MSYAVLLATEDTELRDDLVAKLRELPDIDLAGTAKSSAEVSAAVANSQAIDCLILDDRLGPLPALQLVRETCLRHPHIAVLLMVREPDAALLGTAMQVGARGVLDRAVSLEDLGVRLGAAAEWSRTVRRHLEGEARGVLPGRSGMVVAVAGGKGGTGTTTVAIQLALAATSARRSVCLIDLDLQCGDLATYLDVTHRHSVVDLAETADDINPTVLAETLFAHQLGPHILLAPENGERGEDVTAASVREIVASLRGRYDVTIIDCGSYTSEASAMAVEMADRAVVTVTPDLPALRGARRLIGLWERLQVRKHEDVGIALVRHSRQSEIQPDFAAKIVGQPLIPTCIPATFRALESAANSGAPADVEDQRFRKSIGKLAGDLGLFASPYGGTAEADHPPVPKKQRRKRRGKESGASTVEFLGLIPVMVILILALWESVCIGLVMVTANHAANEGARIAAVGGTTADVRDAAHDHMPDWLADNCTIKLRDKQDKVDVAVRVPVLLPRYQAPWDVTASATVVRE